MGGAEFSAFQVSWFVIAGFILGFATSTLWEWLYYRGKRSTQVEATSRTVLPTIRADSQPTPPDEALAIQPDEPGATAYRGSGIYLESEQPTAVGQSEPIADRVSATPSPLSNELSRNEFLDNEVEEDDPSGIHAHLQAPRINPATLAALQSVVAQSSIAHPTGQSKAYQPPQDAVAPTTRELAEPSSDLPNQPADEHAGKQGQEQDEEQDEEPIKVKEVVNYVASSPAASLTDPLDIGNEHSVSKLTDGETDQAKTDVKVVEIRHAAQAMPHPNRSHRGFDHPDDLALIKGVGEAYKRRLYHAGIYTWRQVAESDTESLRHITRAKPNANIDDWHAQAQELAEKYQRWDTTFRGPLDDFTHIDGIGAITADILYKAGFCTYEQLAAALPDELAKIVPAPTVGDEIDFDGWINAAVQLANAKRRNPGARA